VRGPQPMPCTATWVAHGMGCVCIAGFEFPNEASDVVDEDSEHFFDVYSEEFFGLYSDVYFDCETP